MSKLLEKTTERFAVESDRAEGERPRADAESNSAKTAGVLIGWLVGIDKSATLLVDFPGNDSPEPRVARSVLALDEEAVGREVVLMFENGDLKRPVVMGLLENSSRHQARSVDLSLDRKRLLFTAEEEIVLRCGKASITLTRAGKVLIRGAYVLNRSSGVNRIKGGSVQIN